MPLHADEEGWNLINYFKRRFLKEAAGRIYGSFEDIIEKREEQGWKRTTTSEIRQVFDEVLGNFHPDFDSSDRKFDRDAERLYQLMQVFLVLYDSDDAYANMFHKFVEKCNEEELVLEEGERYLREPPEEMDDYEEKLNRREEDHSKYFDFDRLEL